MRIDPVKALTEVLEANELTDEDGETMTVEALLEQLEWFNDEPAMEEDSSKLYATLAIVTSESGDSFLVLKPGLWSARDFALKAFVMSPTWWVSFENMNVDHIESIEVQSA